MDFATGFEADFAIAIDGNNNVNLFELAAGGNNSLNFITGLSPTTVSNTVSFSLNGTDIGVAEGDTFDFVGTYISGTAFRSNEAFGNFAPLAGNPGETGDIVFTNFNSFTLTAVPDASSLLLCGAALSAVPLRRWRLRRGGSKRSFVSNEEASPHQLPA